MREAVGDDEVWHSHNPDDLWTEDEELRKALRPVLADVGETAQFLALEHLVLTNEARDQFLNLLYEDLAEALKRLMRQADGDYSPDKYRERFAKYEGPDTGDTPKQLRPGRTVGATGTPLWSFRPTGTG